MNSDVRPFDVTKTGKIGSNGKRKAQSASGKKPNLTTVANSTIPTTLRQKFLDGFMEEYLKMGNNEEDAYDNAQSDEKLLSEQNHSKMLYLNSASNHLKKLRIKSATVTHSTSAPKKVKYADVEPGASEVNRSNERRWDSVFPLDEILSTGTNSKSNPRVSKSGSLSTPIVGTKGIRKVSKLNPALLSDPPQLAALQPAGVVYRDPKEDGKYYVRLGPSGGEGQVLPLTSLKHVTFLNKDQSANGDQNKRSSRESTHGKEDNQQSGTPSTLANVDHKIPVPVTEDIKNNFSILKKKKSVTFTREAFYDILSTTYLMSEEELTENSYPRPTEEPGVAQINLKEVVPPITAVGTKAMKHVCCRCQKPFLIYENGRYQDVEECVYHYGRVQRHKNAGEGTVAVYSCCHGDQASAGCQVAKMHVTAGEKKPLQEGYVQTTTNEDKDKNGQVYAMDCEMCYTTGGLELTKVTMVNMECEIVYETLVKPPHPITDYNTRFSGLVPEDFTHVRVTLQEVQQHILNLVSDATILIGHSLESDLRTLKVIHSKVVDTAIVFPHRLGPPYKRALRTLMAEYLNKIIQDNADGGHDSAEDAISCMELMLHKAKSDFQKQFRTGI